MANDLMKIEGVEELQAELKKLGNEFKEIVEPGIKEGGEAIAEAVRRKAPKRKGVLKREIKVKVFNKKGVVARVGVLDSNETDEKGRPVALYGLVQDKRTNFMEKGIKQAESEAFSSLEKKTQQKLDQFHNSQPVSRGPQ